MTPLSEESKKRLTKFLDGCAHIWVRDGHFVSHHQCVECGEEISVRKEFLPKMRSFLTWQDLGDCKEALVKKGLWEIFVEWLTVWRGYRQFSVEEVANQMERIFRPTDEKGEPHFCRLVAEFLKEKEEGKP